MSRKNLRCLDAAQFAAALDILHQRDIRYVSFFGGEPLPHPPDSSVMLDFAVSIGDSLDHSKGARRVAALTTMTNKRKLTSLAGVAENAHVLSRLARLG